MKNSFKTYVWGGSLLISMSLGSCISDNFGECDDLIDKDDATSLTIYIPNGNAEYVSRSGESDGENTINNLYFLAFPDGADTEGDTGKIKIQKLLGDDTDLNFNESTNNYRSVTVTGLQKGLYNVYILANMDGYVDAGIYPSVEALFKTFISSTQVEELVLNFADATTNKYNSANYLSESNLPMACLSNQVKTGIEESSLVSSGKFAFSKENNELYADLNILCAKVRYTVLFDNTPESDKAFSKDFYSQNVDFKEIAFADNVPSQIQINRTPQTDYYIREGITGLPFKKVKYPDDSSSLLGSDAITYEPDLSTEEEDLWETDANQRAWQGTFYFPQTRTPVTSITVTPAETAEYVTDGKFNLPRLERGRFYDVVAKLIKPSTYVFNVNIYVRINPWKYEGTAPEDW